MAVATRGQQHTQRQRDARSTHDTATRTHAPQALRLCGRRRKRVDAAVDESGNARYSGGDVDVGAALRDSIVKAFKARKLAVTVKYIDPSYMIRSVPANASDSIFCDILARHAVHAGMAGKTDLVIGRWNGVFTHVPLSLVTAERKTVDPDGPLWLAVSETTGQPSLSNTSVSMRVRARGRSDSSA